MTDTYRPEDLDWAMDQFRSNDDRSSRRVLSDPTAPNPDEESQVRRTAQRAGLPEADVRLDLPGGERAATAAETSAALQQTPRLRQWMNEPRNAHVARDDVENLSTFERLARAPLAFMRATNADTQQVADAALIWSGQNPLTAPLTAPFLIARATSGRSRDVVDQYQQGELDTEYAGLAFRAHQAQLGRGEALTAEEQGRLDELANRPDQSNWGPLIVGPTARLAPQMLGSLDRAGRQAETRMRELGTEVYGQPDAARDQVRRALNGDLRAGADLAVASGLYAMGAPLALTGGFGGGYLSFGNEMETGLAYDQMIRAGVDPTIAADRATQYGAWATALEFAGDALGLRFSGAGKLLSRAVLGEAMLQNTERSAATAFTRSLLETGLDQGAEEASQELAQILHQQLAQTETARGSRTPGLLENPQGWLSDVGEAWRGALTPESLQQMLFAGFVGFQGGIGMGAVPAATNFGLDMRASAVAEHNARVFEEWTRAAQASRLNERGLTSELESAVGAMDDSTVYVDADRFVEHFQGAGVNPYIVADELGLGEQALSQAIAAHGQIEIPTSTFAARVLRVPAHAGLAEHARLSPNDATPAEVRMAGEVLRADIERLTAETQAAQNDNEIGAIVEERMRDLFARSAAEGGPRSAVASRYSRLVAAMPRALLARARATNPAYADRLEGQFRRFFGERMDVAGPGRADASGADARSLPQTTLAADWTPGGGSKEFTYGPTTITYGVSSDGQTAEIALVRTKKTQRGEGAARAALEALIAEADRKGITLFLTPEPMERGVTKGRLNTLYRSLGFRPNRGRKTDFRSRQSMVREPQPVDDVAAESRAITPAPWIAERFSTAEIDSWLALANDPNATPDEILSHPIQAALEAEAPSPTFTMESVAVPGALADRRYTIDGQTFDAPGYVAHMRAKFEAEVGAPLRQDRVAVIVTGQPGAGKSTTRRGLAGMLGAISIDLDEMRVGIPEYAEGRGSSRSTQAEAAFLRKALLDQILDEGQNALVEMVGKAEPEILATVAHLKAQGYSVSLANVNVSYDNSVRRYAKRTIASGRWVHADFIRIVADEPAQLFNALVEEGSLSGYVQVDGNGPQGSETVTSAQGAIDGEALQAAIRSDRTGSGRESGGRDQAGIEPRAGDEQASEGVQSLEQGPRSLREALSLSDDEVIAWFQENVEVRYPHDVAVALWFKTEDGLARPNVRLTIDDEGGAITSFRGRTSGERSIPNAQDVKKAAQIFVRLAAVTRAWVLLNKPERLVFTGATEAHEKLYRSMLRLAEFPGYVSQERETLQAEGFKATENVTPMRDAPSTSGRNTVFVVVRADIAESENVSDRQITVGNPNRAVWEDTRRNVGTVHKTQIRVRTIRDGRSTNLNGRASGDAASGRSGASGSIDAGNASSRDGARSDLNQSETRGSIRYDGFKAGEFGSAVIRLGEASDLSTFLHEFGHLGHLILESMATDADAPAEFRAMWDNTLAWWGIDQAGWDTLSAEQKVPYFEQWARTFEAYLMDGKAPSLSLKESFAAFRQWLVQIYRTVLRLDAKLNPQIRDVFDRMLATDAEIAEARAAQGADFTLSREAFKSDEEFRAYEAAIAAAKDAQEAELRARVMDSYARKSKRWWRSERERVRDAATRSVDSDRARRALEWLAYQEWRTLPSTDLTDEGEMGYVPSADAMEEMPEDLPAMALDPEAVRADWPEVSLPVAINPRVDLDVVLAEAMRIKGVAKGRGGTRAQRLATAVRAWGGLVDADGRVRAAIGSGRKRPGLVNASGKSPEQLAMRAAAEGYFGAGAARLFLNEDQAESAAKEIIEARRAVNARPQTLTSWVREQGGIADDRGDIAGAAGDAQRGFARLLRGDGRSIDDLALAAWEAGFFPDATARPSVAEFIDALDAEARGERRAADQEAQALADQAERVLNFWQSMGIDTAQSEAKLKDALWGSANPLADDATARELHQTKLPDAGAGRGTQLTREQAQARLQSLLDDAAKLEADTRATSQSIADMRDTASAAREQMRTAAQRMSEVVTPEARPAAPTEKLEFPQDPDQLRVFLERLRTEGPDALLAEQRARSAPDGGPTLPQQTGYHGSSVAGLTELRPGERGPMGPATYFSPNDLIAGRYGPNLYEADVPNIFHGLGSSGFGDSRINPYEVWRQQTARLIDAAAPEQREELRAIIEKMHPEDGYPFFRRVVNLMGSEEAAQGLFRKAGFEGISGHVDGPEIAIFGNVRPRQRRDPAPQSESGSGIPPRRLGAPDAPDAGAGRTEQGPDGGARGGGNAYREQLAADGFDVETRFYHGTDRDFERFDLTRAGENFGDRSVGVSLTPDSAAAWKYAGRRGQGAVIRPVYVRYRNPLVFDAPNARVGNETIDTAARRGDIARMLAEAEARGAPYDAIIARGGPNDEVFQVNILDPENIRPSLGSTELPTAGKADEGGELFQSAPIFVSAVERTVADSKTARAPGGQWWATISRAPGVKKEELQWMGLEDWLKAQDGQVSREDVLQFVRDNGVRVEETVLGEATDANTARLDELQRELLPLIEEDQRLTNEQDSLLYGDRSVPGRDQRLEEIKQRQSELWPQMRDLKDEQARLATQGRTKWSQYTLPGGENYRELLLRLPLPNRPGFEEYLRAYREHFPNATTTDAQVRGFHNQGVPLPARGAAGYQRVETTGDVFRSSHFDQPNILAHVRFNERTDATGKRTLFIEEIQSDWHQAGRERGYRNDAEIQRIRQKLIDTADLDGMTIDAVLGQRGATDAAIERIRAALTPAELETFRQASGTTLVPNAPFKNNAWASLALKRMIRWAAENGFEQIAWTRGEHQIERFSLAREMSRFYYNPQTQEFIGQARGGGQHREQGVTEGRLAELIGKEGARQLLDAPINKDGEHEIAAGDIKVGGEGMRAFYDKILPNIANDLGKKFGARVGETSIETPRVGEDAPLEVRDRDGKVVARYQFENVAMDHAERIGGSYGFPETPQTTVHALPITPEMRNASVDRGMELFQNEKAPTVDEFIAALIADLTNERQVYAFDAAQALASNQDLADAQAWFDANDIDLTKDKDDIRAQIAAALEKAKNDPNLVDPDTAASWFGFSSGDELIQALSALKPRAVAIEDKIDQMLADEHGDINSKDKIQAAARLAAHLEVQAKRIEIELAALEKATGGRSRPVGQAARAYAEKQIQRMTVKQVRNADQYLAGERRAARNAMEFQRKGDAAQAAHWKQRQLISFWLYKFARDAAEEMDKAQSYFRKFDRDTVRSKIHAPLLDQIDQTLESIDLRATPRISTRRRQSFLAWYEEMKAEGLEHMVAVDPDFLDAVRQRPFNTLTIEDARSMRDAVKNFEHIGRRWREVLAARDNRLLDEAVTEMASAMAKVKPFEATNPADHSPGVVERLDTRRQKLHAQLSRVEFVARAMDGMKENGPVWNGLFRPLTEARDREETRQQQAQRDIEALFSVYDAKERADMWVKRKFYAQVPNRDGSRMGRNFTKQEILAIALNTGNEYNFNALLGGDNWTEQQVRALLNAAMDDRDWRFVQSLWDYVETFWPEIDALQRKATGVSLPKVEATPFQNRYGEWRGGYWHLEYDYGRDQRVREEAEHGKVQEAFGGFRMRTMTPHGFAKARQGSGGRPVRLDLAVLTEHVNEVIHDLEFRLPVLNTWRLIKHSEFRSAFVRAAGQEMYETLKPWLQYVATEQMPPERGFADILRLLRRNTPIALMGFALSTVAQQPAGLMGAFHRVGTGRVMGKVLELASQPWTWMEHARFINTRSTLMRNRSMISQREIREMVQEINSQGHIDAVTLLASGTVRQKMQAMTYLQKMMQRYAMFPLAYLDKWVSSAAWKAAYDRALAGHVDGVDASNEADVIAYADHIVRTTFGSGRPEDMSPIMRLSELGKIMTPAFSYFNTQYNQLFNEQTPGMMRGQISPIEFATFITFAMVLQALVSQWLAGRWEPGDDEDEDDRNRRLALEVAMTPTAGIPLVRDITRAALMKASTGRPTFGTSVPAIGAITSTGSGIGGAIHDLSDEGEISRASARDLTMAAGYWFGLPSRQLWTTGSYVSDVATGEEEAPWKSDQPIDSWSEAFLRDTR